MERSGLKFGLDGLAIVTSQGVVIQFLSHGGAFVASKRRAKADLPGHRRHRA